LNVEDNIDSVAIEVATEYVEEDDDEPGSPEH